MTEAAKINHTLDSLRQKVQAFRRIKNIVEELEEQGEVDVHNPRDNLSVHVLATLDEPTEALGKLADMGYSNDRIEYLHEEDQYRLDITFSERR